MDQPNVPGSPAPKNSWVQVGDSCRCVGATMVGVVQKIVPRGSLPYAVVAWSSGYTGRHTITTLIKVEARHG